MRELNRKISETIEPEPKGPPDYRDPSSNKRRAWIWVIVSEGNAFWYPRDWTGDETANAELLEEMKSAFPYFSITFDHERGLVEFEASGSTRETGFYIEVPDEDRKTSNAIAWLKCAPMSERLSEEEFALNSKRLYGVTMEEANVNGDPRECGTQVDPDAMSDQPGWTWLDRLISRFLRWLE